MRILLLQPLLVVCILLVFQPALSAQQGGTITVVGTGQASAQPDQLVISVSLSKDGKTIAEAAENFATALQKLTDALNPMDFAGIEIRNLGKSISEPDDSQMLGVVIPGMGGGDDETPPSSYAISESYEVLFPNKSDQLAELAEVVQRVEEKVVEVGGKLGIKSSPYVMMGNNTMAWAKLADPSPFEEKAWENAIAEAKKKAAVLARLSGVKLGKIVSISESEGDSSNALMAIYGAATKERKLGDVKVSRSLIVEFEAVP